MFRKLLLYFALLLWFVVPAKAQLTIMLPEMEVEQGDLFFVDVKVLNFDAVSGGQFSFQWNKNQRQYQDSIDRLLPIPGGFTKEALTNASQVDQGRLGFFWYDDTVPMPGIDLADSSIIIRFQFKAIGSMGMEDSLIFTNKPMGIEFGDDNGPFDTVALQHGFIIIKDINASTRIQEAGNLRLLPNQPNPFTTITRFNFELIKAEDVRLTVYDLQGRALWLQEKYLHAGKHQIQFNGADLPASGTYWLELRAGEHQLRQQLVHLK